ncbi:hypothetical protein [Haloarchaeobius sp. HRN-SO-5]|uniref:hypothetical protein n=1 Tax=Haloarchaeobius sp. HRN-SO-5 TaxID=3446118 RepID=UPI003EC0FA82
MVQYDGPDPVETVGQRDRTETGGIMTGAWHLLGLSEVYESAERDDADAEGRESAGDD